MINNKRAWIVFIALFIHKLTFAVANENDSFEKNRALTQPVPIKEIKGFDTFPEKIQHLIKGAYELSEKALYYRYGSANPENGGMDCSGTIYYLLRTYAKLSPPRQANQMYSWVREKGRLRLALTHSKDYLSKHIQPGDLLFWSGTYSVNRMPPITHVMIYLGKNKKNAMLMFGASEGRYYEGRRMNGVSTFTFSLPREGSRSKFVGYSCIPGYSCKD